MLDKFITFIAVVVGLIVSAIVALPLLVLRYGVIVLAVYIVYKIFMYFIGG